MYDFTTLEKYIANYWQGFHTFRLSNDRRKGKQFVFYDGPPFATGTPHYGHLLVGTIKDAVARYKNMSGYRVPRQWGWDCHGVPVETLVQNKLGLTRVDALQNDKVHEFNEECRSSVLLCADQWRETVSRMGRWVDFDHSYKTMDKDYMESVWWVFKQLFDQGRVYQAKKVMPYSCKLQTTLSKHEMMDSYREVEDPYVVVKFKLVEEENTYFLAYTTTPWTLPTNAGLCVNPHEEYSFVVCNGDTYVLASKLVGQVMWDMKYSVKKTVLGSQLLRATYHALFTFQHLHVVTDDFVTVNDGTGVVHLSPAFGEDDYRVGQKYALNLVDYLDAEGKFSDSCPEYKGLFAKDADKEVISDLLKACKIFKVGKVKHDYPFCDRTNTPLIYRAVDAWYVRLEDVKDRLLKNNSEVRWVPEAVGTNRFANWLKEAKDWNVSRNRLWGCCLPLWVSSEGDVLCFGSVKELEDAAGVTVLDLHKDTLDKVSFTKCGKTYHRVPEVLDCWFESGCMPYAQHHYPFENKEMVEASFPADFVVEGLDQTRGWFYTLLVLGTLLFDKCPFKNVVVNGMVLAEDGTKMSKSKKNYADPMELMNTYGADALRAYFLSSGAMAAEPMLFKEKDLQNMVRSLMLPLNNALDFYKLYSEADEWYPAVKEFTPTRELDEWLLAELNVLIYECSQHMEDYELSRVLPKVTAFLDKLCNWYIRLSRKLFWEEGVSLVKTGAYHTLHCALFNLVRLLAPFMPFLTEQMYCDLGNRGSVHWEDYPRAFALSDREKDLLDRMKVLRTLSSMGHNLRVKANIKVRQPLAKMFVSGVSSLTQNDKNLLKEELNLKAVILQQTSNQLTAKANFRSLGRRCGKDTQQVAKAIAALNTQDLLALQMAPLHVEGYQVSLEDVLLTQVSSSPFPTEILDNLSVSLDTTLTPELTEEGDMRELCSVIQGQRKTMKLHMTDRVVLVWTTEESDTFNFMKKWGPEVEKIVLANSELVFDQETMQGTKVFLSCGNLYFILKRDQ